MWWIIAFLVLLFIFRRIGLTVLLIITIPILLFLFRIPFWTVFWIIVIPSLLYLFRIPRRIRSVVDEAEQRHRIEEMEAEVKRREEENRRRLSIPCRYDDGFTREQFEQTVYRCAKRIKRIKKTEINGLIISCTVESRSGISDWSFELDFHDYGHYTGRCILRSGNWDSTIDTRLRDLIIEELKAYTQ